MKFIFQFLQFFLIAYLIIVILVYTFQEKLLFFPVKLNNNLYLQKFKKNEITIEHQGIKLHGWLNNPGKDNIILYYGGNAEEVSANIFDFIEFQDYSVLLMNYRGYGKSTGSPGQNELFSDALHIYDALVSKSEIDYKNIVVFGRSLGSGVAAYISGQRRVSKIVLVTPYDSITNIAKKHYAFLPISCLLKHPFNSVEYLKNNTVPVLVLAAAEDTVIPSANTQALVNTLQNSCTYKVVKNRGHNDIQESTEYWSAIHEFLNK